MGPAGANLLEELGAFFWGLFSSDSLWGLGGVSQKIVGVFSR